MATRSARPGRINAPTSRGVKPQDEKLRKEVDPERGELFFARRLLVVEGDTEKLAFPEYATRLPLDLNRAGARGAHLFDPALRLGF
jgi:predicted ATP-dependent endonuclease of OLD family